MVDRGYGCAAKPLRTFDCQIVNGLAQRGLSAEKSSDPFCRVEGCEPLRRSPQPAATTVIVMMTLVEECL